MRWPLSYAVTEIWSLFDQQSLILNLIINWCEWVLFWSPTQAGIGSSSLRPFHRWWIMPMDSVTESWFIFDLRNLILHFGPIFVSSLSSDAACSFFFHLNGCTCFGLRCWCSLHLVAANVVCLTFKSFIFNVKVH